MNKTKIVISKLIDECCEHVHAGGIYTIITKGDVDAEVYADTEWIDQVVINFVNNAMNYAPESKQINIHIKKTNDLVKVSVSDTGPGIPAEKQAHFSSYLLVNQVCNFGDITHRSGSMFLSLKMSAILGVRKANLNPSCRAQA